jgi:hypothetical protein
MWWSLAGALASEREAVDEQVSPSVPTEEPGGDAIINGGPAKREDWPMTGGLLMGASATIPGFGDLSARALMCSSTLIAPDVVLTAAHCVDIQGLADLAGQGGYPIEDLRDLEFAWSRQEELYQWDLVDSALNGPKEWPEDTVFAVGSVYHPDFDLATLQVGLAKNFDIALVFLAEPVLDVPFAVLPTEEEADQVAVGAPVTIVGWGQQQQDVVPGSVGIKMMAESTIDEVARFEFQVGKEYESGRKCHGDSGGPTFLSVETSSADALRVVGVTSHAYDTTDCRVTGGVDTRVDFFLDWIDAEMRAACDDGTRVWCDEPGIIAPPDEEGRFAWENTAPVEEEQAKGCGCDSTSRGGWGLALAGLLVLAQRRGTPAPRASCSRTS